MAFGPENLVKNPELRERVDMALEAVGMSKYRETCSPYVCREGKNKEYGNSRSFSYESGNLWF